MSIINDEETCQTDEENNNKTKFHKRLTNILFKFNLTFETANIWMLNQLIIPLTQTTNLLKLRYQTPKNDFIIYNASTTTSSNHFVRYSSSLKQ